MCPLSHVVSTIAFVLKVLSHGTFDPLNTHQCFEQCFQLDMLTLKEKPIWKKLELGARSEHKN